MHVNNVVRKEFQDHSLHITPIKTCGAQQGSSAVVVKASTGLDIARDMGSQRLAFRSNPIDDWTFHTLGVISPGTIGTLLDLFAVNAQCRY